jgi:hypothetical protein
MYIGNTNMASIKLISGKKNSICFAFIVV